MIEVRGLTKRYGATVAVDDLSFDVLPGRVTGFLGPNGSGKSTTMRTILGLDAPSSGEVLVCDRPYPRLGPPLRAVAALPTAGAVHRRRAPVHHRLPVPRGQGLARAPLRAVIRGVCA